MVINVSAQNLPTALVIVAEGFMMQSLNRRNMSESELQHARAIALGDHSTLPLDSSSQLAHPSSPVLTWKPVLCGTSEEAAAVFAQAQRSSNDRHDSHDRYTTSLGQRQEQASAFHREQFRELSRPSSSSGSAGSPELRRTSQFEDPSRQRSSSVDSPTRRAASPSLIEEEVAEEDRAPSPRRPTNHRRATSAHFAGTTPHPALRISRRTQTAILYALEEAIRKPNLFTPDEEEENAQMSDLGGGRASNGGARNTGPVPVSSRDPPTERIRTPRDIMRDRNNREAQRREDEQRRQAEERRDSASRRVADVPGVSQRLGGDGSQYSEQAQAPQGSFAASGDRRSRTSGMVAGAEALGQPTSRSGQEYTGSGPRGSSSSHQDSSRATPANTSGTRRTHPNQPGVPRQPAPQSSTTGGGASFARATSTGDGGARNTSSFPHAFERWETLSAHWEGLTSYWLHKLEQNTEEIRETVPNASTLNRQITDLSAAGANLFHAVVELQRLRASSERKFQRWFFETRADNERNREIQASLERSLEVEKNAKEEILKERGNDSMTVENAHREVTEMRRELMISKDEARRAWEELGRRNQDSLDTAQSLKEGRMTIVAGVQVVPYFGQPSRTGSASQRPVTRDGQGYTGTGLSTTAGGGMQSPVDERQYYRERPSPTNTDPFTEGGRHQGSYQGQGGVPEALAAATAGASTREGSAGPYRRSGDRSHVTSGDAERFYQHPVSETLLHSPETTQTRNPGTHRDDIRSEGSYVDTISEGGTEYAIDAMGNVQRDIHGQPVVFQRRRGGGGQTSNPAATAVPPPAQTAESAGEYDDDFDTQETIRQHEQELAQHFDEEDEPEDLPEAPSVPAAQHGQADYEGQGFDNWEDRVRATTTHHHPTRLSDVLEEEDERSSRRTAD